VLSPRCLRSDADHISSQLLAIASWSLAATVEILSGGGHIWDLTLDIIEQSLKLGLVTSLLTTYSNIFIKLSVCTLLLRIKGSTSTVWRWAIIGLVASLILVGIASTVTILVQCRPLSAFWTISERYTGPYCWSGQMTAAMYAGWGGKDIYTRVTLAGQKLNQRQSTLPLPISYAASFLSYSSASFNDHSVRRSSFPFSWALDLSPVAHKLPGRYLRSRAPTVSMSYTISAAWRSGCTWRTIGLVKRAYSNPGT